MGDGMTASGTAPGIAGLARVPGLSVTLSDGVLSVTLDRPETLNSLTAAMLGGVADAMDAAGRDPRVRVVRLAGAGRGFSSGAGLDPEDAAAGSLTDTLTEANRATRAIVAVPRPVVAVLQGPTAGVGASLALACDLVLASEQAFLLLAFTKIGLMPDGGATALVAAAIGRLRAMRMALLAERIPAAQALEWGLVSAVYPADELETRVDETVAALLAGPAIALARTKLAVNAATLADLDAALDREYVGQSALLFADDFREGVRAFQQKRPARFTDS